MLASDMTRQWGGTYIFGRRSYFSDSRGGYWNSGMWEWAKKKFGSGIITCKKFGSTSGIFTLKKSGSGKMNTPNNLEVGIYL